MTGGCVLILGTTGKNFAAGMSGGIAYVLDEENHLYRNLNKQLVNMETPKDEDLEAIKDMLEKHVAYTGSKKGKEILDEFESYAGHFKKIIPGDYEKMMAAIAKYEKQGQAPEDAKLKCIQRDCRHDLVALDKW